MIFQYYNGNIRHATPRGRVTIEQFIASHKNPHHDTEILFIEIDLAAKLGDKALKNKLKEGLYYFTPSAFFNGRRRYVNIVSFTGLAQIDFDNIKEAQLFKEQLFNDYKELVCCYLSPSRKGVKALMKIPISKDIHEFKEYYAGIEEEMKQYEGFDSSPKNVALPLYLSHDKNILFRDDYTEWNVKGDVMKEADYVNLITEKPKVTTRENSYYERITIEIFKKKINEINEDPGHPRMRDACLVLGSRCGAGYMTYSEGLELAVYMVSNNHYLQKGLKNYLRTVNWAMKQGYSQPKHYKTN